MNSSNTIHPYKVCIIGASGKLGQYMVQHSLDRGYEVVGVCREKSVHKLDRFKDRIEIYPGRSNDSEVVKKAVKGCDGVLTVLVPFGVDHYSLGTARSVLEHSSPDARLIFSCGWHISMDGKDKYSTWHNIQLNVFIPIGRLFRLFDINDQVEACDLIFSSDAKWTVVRGSGLEEGESEGLPVWSEHVGDPILESDMTRRVDFALFMVEALVNDSLIHKAPAIVGCKTESVLEYSEGL